MAKSESKKVVISKKNYRNELREKVYNLAGVSNTKALKSFHVDFKSMDFRRTNNWEKAFKLLKGLENFDEWRSSPPEKYREIFAEIDQVSDEYKKNVVKTKKVLESLDTNIKKLSEITKEAKCDVESLKKETPISIPVLLPKKKD